MVLMMIPLIMKTISDELKNSLNSERERLSSLITYSPAFTLVPTYECFNRCHYCNFRQDLGKTPWLSLEQAQKILEKLQPQGVCEILVLSGEVHPNSPQRPTWFQRIYDLCQLAMVLDFLPHTNVGPLSFEEMAQLKSVNASMGLMLEQLSPMLEKTVHRAAPSKIPQLRLQQLKWAGELEIPFTTGLLLGIGETNADCDETLAAIAHFHRKWGHIQEVILQPYRPGDQESLAHDGFDLSQLPSVVAKARKYLPRDITIQVPPNLIDQPDILLACLDAGARDLGGIGIKDEVNPNYPHPQIKALSQILEPAGWTLHPRLPVYPHYFNQLSPPFLAIAQKWQARLLSL